MNDFRFLTKKQLLATGKYPFSLNALSLLIFKSKENGLDEAVFRVGRRVLIREDLFDNWLQSRK